MTNEFGFCSASSFLCPKVLKYQKTRPILSTSSEVKKRKEKESSLAGLGLSVKLLVRVRVRVR